MKPSAQNNKQKQPLQTKDQVFKPQAPLPLRKLNGVKTYPQGMSPPDNFLQLDKVIGLSSRGSTSIAVNPVTGEIAYPAGAIICIYNPKENKQTKFLYSVQQQRSFSCLTFSPDGKYLAAGEGAFRQPEITIWEIDKDSGEYKEIKHLRGHKYGIESVMFSPNILYLISLGDANDRGLFVWDWRTEQRVTSNKLGKPVNTFAFSSLNSFFVTAGYQHLKYWYFDEHGRVQKTIAQAAGNSTESIMESKSADLTKVKVKIFVGVQCVANGGQSGKEEQVFALASDGHLYVYDKNRKLTKWMNIKVDRALSCIIGGDHLFCACNDGIIRIFSSKSLEHIQTLPKPPPLGSANVESGNKKIRIPANKDSRFADALAVMVDEKNQRIVVLYSDRMIFIWDISKMDKVSVYRTLYSHCGPIYDLQYIPNNLPIGFQTPQDQATQGDLVQNQPLTDDQMMNITKFATCSADRTIRFWNFLDPSTTDLKSDQLNKLLVKNAYCKDMSKMIYVSNVDPRDPSNPNSLKYNLYEYFKAKPITLNEDGTPIQDASLTSQHQRELEQLRCIKISPDGKHLACGDWTGNIRIHDLQNSNSSLYSTYDEIQCIQAHDSEVVCLDYSPINSVSVPGTNVYFGGSVTQNEEMTNKYWLASGSRDRLTHIYEYTPSKDSEQSSAYQNVAILDDHSSTITSIKFAEERSLNGLKRRMKLISSGADKQIVVRGIQPAGTNFMTNVANSAQTDAQSDGVFQTWLLKKEQCKHKVLSMDVAGGYGISGHDKYIQLWQVTTPMTSGFEKQWDRKADSQKKSTVLDHLRVVFGPSNQTGFGSQQQPGCEIIIASCADKTVTIYETATGNAVCRTTCGEVTTAMCLSTNLKHLITTSMDGIIYFWKLPESLTKALTKLRSEQPIQNTQTSFKLKSPEQQQNKQLQQSPFNPSSFNLGAEYGAANQLNKSEEFDFGERKDSSNQFEEDQNAQNQDYMDESSMIDQSQMQQPPPSISMIMQQINQVTSQIEKIQPLRNRGMGGQTLPQPQPQSSEDLLQEEDTTTAQQQLSQQQVKRRNAWGAKTSPRVQGSETEMEPIYDPNASKGATIEKSQIETKDSGIRPLQIKENKLPRWAQSMAGITGLEDGDHESGASQDQDPFSQNRRVQHAASNLSNIQEDNVDEIFEGTLEKIQPNQNNDQEEEEKKPLQIGGAGVNQGVFYRKHEEATNDNNLGNDNQDDQEDISPIKSMPPKPTEGSLIPEDEDPDEMLIREQLRLRNHLHKPMLGLDSDDEESEGEGINKKNNRVRSEYYEQQKSNKALKRPSENRQSQSQLFLQRKQIQQSISDLQNKPDSLQVEDIFNDHEYDEVQKIPNKPITQDATLFTKLESKISEVNRYANPINSNNNTLYSQVEDSNEETKQIQSHPPEVDKSIQSDQTSMVQIKVSSQIKQKEENVNRLLQEEIAKINQSLFRINQCLNSVKVEESQQLGINIKDDVTQSLRNSVDLWNNMAAALGIKHPPMPEASESQENFGSKTKTTQQAPNLTSVISNQSIPLSSSISIKEDAKDLLEKYSDLLLAEVLKKINNKSTNSL